MEQVIVTDGFFSVVIQILLHNRLRLRFRGQNMLLLQEGVNNPGFSDVLCPQVIVVSAQTHNLLKQEIYLRLVFVSEFLHFCSMGDLDALQHCFVALVVVQGMFQVFYGVVELCGCVRRGFFEGKIAGVLATGAKDGIRNCNGKKKWQRLQPDYSLTITFITT